MFKQTGLQVLTNYIMLVERMRSVILLFFILISVVAGVYTVNNLGMNTDTREMLSADLPWRQMDLNYEKHFPQFLDTILIVIEGNTPDQAADTATLLNRKLNDEPSLINTIYYPRSLSTFRENALLFFIRTGVI